MNYQNNNEIINDFITALEYAKQNLSESQTIATSNLPPPSSNATTEPPVKEKKKRCAECHKKLGLISFPCKCGGEYCAIHRIDSTHNCSYDYKSVAQKSLSTMLVKVVASKVEAI